MSRERQQGLIALTPTHTRLNNVISQMRHGWVLEPLHWVGPGASYLAENGSDAKLQAMPALWRRPNDQTVRPAVVMSLQWQFSSAKDTTACSTSGTANRFLRRPCASRKSNRRMAVWAAMSRVAGGPQGSMATRPQGNKALGPPSKALGPL